MQTVVLLFPCYIGPNMVTSLLALLCGWVWTMLQEAHAAQSSSEDLLTFVYTAVVLVLPSVIPSRSAIPGSLACEVQCGGVCPSQPPLLDSVPEEPRRTAEARGSDRLCQLPLPTRPGTAHGREFGPACPTHPKSAYVASRHHTRNHQRMRL